jgi:ABC-type proline/glycine betaine transport system permease subunit
MISRFNVEHSFRMGIAIVLLAIIFDRIKKLYGERL